MENLGSGDSLCTQEELKTVEWSRLPELVQINIFKYLDRKSINCMRQTSTSTQDLIDYEYGLHVVVPARNWNLLPWGLSFCRRQSATGTTWSLSVGRRQNSTTTITDAMIGHRWMQLQGKVVRILDMEEMPSTPNPFQFDMIIHHPLKLYHIKLKYVDVQLLHSIFTKCLRLKTLQYATGLYRPVPNGPIARLFLMTSFSQVPLPSTDQRLINFVSQTPTPGIQLSHLRTLEIRLEQISLFHQSDWANAVYILLALPLARNLREFKFYLFPGVLMQHKDYYLIIAVLAEFLSKTNSLVKMVYHSDVIHINHDPQVNLPYSLPRSVMSALFKAYGSNRLQELEEKVNSNNQDGAFREINQMLEQAGRSLHQLQELELNLLGNYAELATFRGFFQKLPNLKSCFIMDSPRGIDDDGDDDNRLFNIFLSPNANIFPSQKTIKRLCLFNKRTRVPLITLCSLLNKYPELEHLNIDQRITLENPDLAEEEDIEVAEEPDENGVILVRQGVQTTERTDILIRDDDMALERLKVLHLSGLNILASNIPTLLKCSNLTELTLLIPKGYKHNYFGIRSCDLIMIIAKLRKLSKILAQPVQFLERLNTTRTNINALAAVGTLELLVCPEQQPEILNYKFSLNLSN